MTTNELIKKEIQSLHDRNSGDWESLMRQVDTRWKEIPYNFSQTIALTVANHLKTVKNIDLEWSRGTGKTTLLAAFARRIKDDLPRGAFQWEVPTYQKFLTEIIPAFIHGLEMQGLYKDLHYFIGRRPPSKWNWVEPYKPPGKYDNFIVFHNGFGINLLSQDNAGAGRGLSTDGRITSETTMLNKKKLDEESGPSIRGSNTRAFKDKRFFDFRIMESSTPLTEAGAWFIERENLARTDPGIHRFLRANCVENIELGWLKEDYLIEARRTTTDIVTFEAEYLNIRPRLNRGGFYALLNEAKHSYTSFDYNNHYSPDKIGVAPDSRGDSDCIPNLPLMVGMDFGAAINSIVVGQHVGAEFRVLKNFFVKGAEGKVQDDVCEQLCEYFAHHQNKEIRFFHDASGGFSTGHTKVSRGVQAQNYFLSKGWKVVRLTMGGTNPRHSEKYRLWEVILSEKNARLPKFRINRSNAKECFISMARAQIRQNDRGETKKWKGQERVENKTRELATDLSDALDYMVFTLFNQLSKEYGAPLPG